MEEAIKKTLVSEESQDLPEAEYEEVSLLIDVTDRLSYEDIRQFYQDTCAEDGGPKGTEKALITHMTYLSGVSPIPVVLADFRRILSWLNSRPFGQTINMSNESVQKKLEKQAAMIKQMRSCYFPGRTYKHCVLFRGVLTALPKTRDDMTTSPSILAWKKNNRKSLIYAID